jgi:hypothetical protein
MMLLFDLILQADPGAALVEPITQYKTDGVELIKVVGRLVYGFWFVYCLYEIFVSSEIKTSIVKLLAGAIVAAIIEFVNF